MAVTITKGKGIDHHRNPSGLHNKVLWILSEMKWDLNNFESVQKSVVVDENSKSAESWKKAFDLVAYLLMPHFALSSKTFARGFVNEARPWYKKLVDKCHDTEGKIAALQKESKKFVVRKDTGLSTEETLEKIYEEISALEKKYNAQIGINYIETKVR